jgi:hypothetical protein
MTKNVRWYGKGSVTPARSGGSTPSEGLLLGLPHVDVLENLVYAVSGTRPAALRACCSSRSLAGRGLPPFLMSRGGLRFWVLISILSSVILTMILNLLLLF